MKCSCRLFNYRYNATKYVKLDNIMNRKSKSLFTFTGISLTGIAAVAMLSFSQVSLDNRNMFCGNLFRFVVELLRAMPSSVVCYLAGRLEIEHRLIGRHTALGLVP